jgi:hypothetical protein
MQERERNGAHYVCEIAALSDLPTTGSARPRKFASDAFRDSRSSAQDVLESGTVKQTLDVTSVGIVLY